VYRGERCEPSFLNLIKARNGSMCFRGYLLSHPLEPSNHLTAEGYLLFSPARWRRGMTFTTVANTDNACLGTLIRSA